MLKDFQFQTLLDKQVSRKDFIRYVGVTLISVIGVGKLLATLLENYEKTVKPKQQKAETRSFGGGKYGT